MSNLQHCLMCEHQLLDVMTGTKCGLTQQKPDFYKTCSTIKLDQKLNKRVKKLNVDLELLRKRIPQFIVHFFFYLFLGVGAIWGGYYLGQIAFESHVIHAVPLIVMFIGLALIVMGISPGYRFNQKWQVALKNKSDMDQILSAYGVTYSIKMDIGKEIHGSRDVQVDLEISKKP